MGEGSLAEHCAERLLAHGFAVVATYADDSSLRAWSDDHAVTALTSRDDVVRFVQRARVNLLFSVRNPWILPPAVLDAITEATINYHDSALPRHAGMYATTWALIAGEREHGITWHRVDVTIDTGAIDEQVAVTIEPDDTAFTLNTRCFQAAIEGFERLLPRLAAGTAEPTPQPTGPGSYHAKFDRPAAGCRVPVEHSGRACIDLVRGLTFGPIENPIGLPHLVLDNRVVAYVTRARAVTGSSSAPPGTIVTSRDDVLRVATADGDIELGDCIDVHGRPLTTDDLTRLGARSSATLAIPTSAQREAIDAVYRAAARQHAHWRDRLLTPTPVRLPFARPAAPHGGQRIALPRVDQVLASFADRETAALAVLAAYLLRIGDGDAHDVATSTPKSPTPGDLLARFVPWRLPSLRPTAARFDRARWFDTIRDAWLDHRRRGSYAADLPLRVPALRARVDAGEQLLPRVAILYAGDAWDDGDLDRFDAAFIIDDAGLQLVVGPNFVDPAVPSRIASQLECLIGAWHRDARTTVAELSLLEPAERARIIAAGEGERIDYPCDRGVHHLVLEQADRSPNAIAVRDPDVGDLTYARLRDDAGRLARGLAERGVATGDRVGVCLPASADAIVTMLATLILGAAYVPIDPTYPSARIAHIVSDAELAWVVGRTDTLANIESRSRFVLDRSTPEWSTRASAFEPTSVAGLDCAYVIYTSGTTGTPKGVEIPHRGLLNHACAMGDRVYQLAPSDRVLLSASLGFDIAGEQIWPALTRGAAVVVAPAGLLQTLHGYSSFVDEHAVTTLILPTSFWHQWIRSLDETHGQVPASVRIVGVGTEAVATEAYAAWRRVTAGRVRWFQGYGPTETTITCTAFEPALDADLDAIVPIGRPLPNTTVHVLDAFGHPVAPTVIGEVVVGGEGVALGYRNRPDLTQQRFVPDPLDPQSSRRVYATGDLAYRDDDGHLVFVGRDDEQIKIRGFRVEPAEVEAIVNRAPGVRQAVVIVHRGTGTGQLVAYVRAPVGERLDVDALHRYLAQQLPDYMVPAALVAVDAFPLTPHHKIDRRALAQRAVRFVAPTTHDATVPRDDVELQVASIFAQALGRAPDSVHTDFFALGGDSLVALRVLDRIRHACDIELTLADMFAQPTVAGIADAVRRGGGHVTNRVIALNDAQHGTPLYMMCGLALYREFAETLRDDCPVRGVYLPEEVAILQNPIDHRPPNIATVSWLARHYVDTIIEHCPNGPLAVGGVSFGGIVAYEVARLLAQEGRQVEYLLLVDAILPSAVHVPAPVRVFRAFKRFGIELRRRWQTSEVDDEKAESTFEARLDAHRTAAYHGAMVEFDATPHHYTGDALLFRASEPAFGPRTRIEPKRGWDRRIRGTLRVHEAEGGHLDVLRGPTAKRMAETLRREVLGGIRAAQV